MIDVSGVREGMDVHGNDGSKLGTVAAVQTTMIGGSGLDTGGVTTVDGGSTPNTYIRISNHRTLWVPVNQISRIDDDGVHLECDRDGCEVYGIEPSGLN